MLLIILYVFCYIQTLKKNYRYNKKKTSEFQMSFDLNDYLLYDIKQYQPYVR